ncbi:MAG: cation:proton antiporter [Bacteroidales bacterium]|nr:cation:proton antiporter [Bacteroidales bacterium]
MLAVVNIDPLMSKFVLLSLIIIAVGMVLRILRQPSMITYILVGVVVGPFGLKLIADEALISNLGSMGLVLLLFFIGMEIHLPDLIANWKVSVFGTLLQVLISVSITWLIGYFFGWAISQVIVLGFVLSLSSTAVIVKMLEERQELGTRAGRYVLGILLVQDILIVPMLIIIGYLGGHRPDGIELVKQLAGGFLIIGIILYVLWKKEIKIPFQKIFIVDKELQVFLAFILCFGFSMLTAWFGLSAALGAFVAGIVVSSVRSTRWVSESLHAFKILFVALFFVSVGMLINLQFIRENLGTIVLLVSLIFVLNNAINVLALRSFCKDWKVSLYAGSLLAQVGEFSFILSSMAYFSGIIGDFVYQLTISIIALSLFLSPFYINLIRWSTGIKKH